MKLPLPGNNFDTHWITGVQILSVIIMIIWYPNWIGFFMVIIISVGMIIYYEIAAIKHILSELNVKNIKIIELINKASTEDDQRIIDQTVKSSDNEYDAAFDFIKKMVSMYLSFLFAFINIALLDKGDNYIREAHNAICTSIFNCEVVPLVGDVIYVLPNKLADNIGKTVIHVHRSDITIKEMTK